MKKTVCFAVFFLYVLTFAHASFAVHYARPKVCAELKEINKDTGILTFLVPKTKETLVLKVGRLSRFLENGHYVAFNDLNPGMKGEVTYKAPLLTDRYLVIFRWQSLGEMDSKVCNDES